MMLHCLRNCLKGSMTLILTLPDLVRFASIT